jgi:hypothetical protein
MKTHPRLAFASEEGGGGHWPVFHSSKMKIKKIKTFIFKKHTPRAQTTRLASFGPVFIIAAHPNPPMPR